MNAETIAQKTRVVCDLIVVDPDGLHVRPAAQLVKALSQLDAKVTVHYGTMLARGTSMLEILSLGAQEGDCVSVVAEGVDAEELPPLIEILTRQAAFASVR